jgi:pyruvate formate lyase activating enzyme
MALPYFGLVSSLSTDPIEKKPLHHFLPGSAAFSVGFAGCNLRCPFCQNWSISQELPPRLEAFSPESLVKAALRSGAPSIAYTYSEPCVHFEFVRNAMTAARRAGLKNVLVTNGCLSPTPARELLALTDAANVDLKSWSADAYEKVLGGDRDAVLEFIRIASSICHLELTTLVVPGISDDEAGILSIASFIAGLSPDIPLHLSAYRPEWKFRSPPTDPALLASLAAAAGAQLRYVFVGNVPGRSSDTLCPDCGSIVVSRRGYRIDTSGLRKTDSAAYCANCGMALHIKV